MIRKYIFGIVLLITVFCMHESRANSDSMAAAPLSVAEEAARPAPSAPPLSAIAQIVQAYRVAWVREIQPQVAANTPDVEVEFVRREIAAFCEELAVYETMGDHQVSVALGAQVKAEKAIQKMHEQGAKEAVVSLLSKRKRLEEEQSRFRTSESGSSDHSAALQKNLGKIAEAVRVTLKVSRIAHGQSLQTIAQRLCSEYDDLRSAGADITESGDGSYPSGLTSLLTQLRTSDTDFAALAGECADLSTVVANEWAERIKVPVATAAQSYNPSERAALARERAAHCWLQQKRLEQIATSLALLNDFDAAADGGAAHDRLWFEIGQIKGPSNSGADRARSALLRGSQAVKDFCDLGPVKELRSAVMKQFAAMKTLSPYASVFQAVLGVLTSNLCPGVFIDWQMQSPTSAE